MKNIKNNIKNIVVASLPLWSMIGGGMSLASCDFLDQAPDERIEADNMTEDQIKAFLVTAYPTANYAWICELSSDNYIDNNAPHKAAGENNDKDASKKLIHYNLNPREKMDDEIFAFEPAKSSTSYDSPTALWSAYYESIAQVNQILVSIDKLLEKRPDHKKSDAIVAAIAECKLIRAYNYFCLVNVFSPAYRSESLSSDPQVAIGVPFIDTPEDKVMVQYDRGNVADIYKKIEKDLEEGLKDISDINMDKPKWRFTPAAAHAFAARFYLFKHDWKKVIEHADAVLGTDYAALPDHLMTYTVFDGATSGSDYVTHWQHPDLANNIMLLSTSNSVLGRRAAGTRYGFTSTPLTEVWQHWGPINSVYPFPTLFSCGSTYYRGESDYGFFQQKVGEEFEYTDKVAGIGYVHHIRPEFTGNKLLLERAEAKLMLGDLQGCSQDLCAWSDTRLTLPKDAYAAYVETGKLKPLTDALLVNFYKDTKNYNCFSAEQWNTWMQTVSNEFTPITAEMLPYMNCLNYSRRYENLQEGYRFLDIKRWGMEVTHVISDGKGGTFSKTLTSLDPRKAIEVPHQCLAAGLGSSIATKPAVSAFSGGSAGVKAWNPVIVDKPAEK